MTKEEMEEVMNGLIKKGLVVKTESGYRLTHIGRIVSDKLEEQESKELLN
jgi:predicted transcriptional regulator